MRAVIIKMVAGCCLLLSTGLAAVAASAAPSLLPSNVVFNVPADVPLRLVNFKFDTSRPDMVAFHYDVQNVSGQGLLAVELGWRAEFGDKGAVSISNRDDRWLTGQLATGRLEHFQVTNVPNLGAEPLTRLVATVRYAEFEDGSALGVDAAAIAKDIDSGRRATLASYARLLDSFNKAGSEALIQGLKVGSATSIPRELPAVQEANARLLGMLHDQGVDAVVLELQRVSTLRLPEPPA
ncbi:MAG TPA: hypothetical protein VL523_17330 [Terriglobia bacterium]|nr:hypothetical protein [Terriglobia bacterium]